MSSNKRPRYSSNIPIPCERRRSSIGDYLPDALLANVASYLSKTSRGLFAVAMTASSPSWERSNWKCQPSLISKTIIQAVQGNNDDQWESLDFMDLEKDARVKLRDGDIGGLFVCIDAVTKLKSLKLTHCFNISGACLELLRTSVVLENIDLSLVEKHENPNISFCISEEVTIPILQSILNASGSKLVHLQFPGKWRAYPPLIFHEFLEEYNQVLNSRMIPCSQAQAGEDYCEGICQGTDPHPWINDFSSDAEFGIPSLTCYQCMSNFCIPCGRTYGDNLVMCSYCEKYFCAECLDVRLCSAATCIIASCDGCSRLNECEGCELQFCDDCEGDNLNQCQCCSDKYCITCSDHMMYYCANECGKSNCVPCSVKSMSIPPISPCRGCEFQ